MVVSDNALSVVYMRLSDCSQRELLDMTSEDELINVYL